MDKLGDVISRQAWLEPIETALGTVADAIFGKAIPFRRRVRNFLHGTWFGHPLHPAITDIPLGAWTVATVCDIYGRSTGDGRLGPSADVAVQIGLIGASAAAMTGLNDWNYTFEKPRRVGALHAVINIAATACYLGSWWQRRSGCREAGVTTGFVGYGLVILGAYLGGHLVYNERIGVNHAAEELPKKFVPVVKESELSENVMLKAEADGVPVLVVKHQGRVFVMAERCSHLGGPLAEGEFDGKTVTCPWHYSRFEIADGSVLIGPAAYRQPCFEVRLRNGQVEARKPHGMVPNPY